MQFLLVFVVILLTIYILCLIGLMGGFARLRQRLRHLPLNSEAALPLVSVVVAARNEAHNLPRLLSCLAAQDYPREKYEVIIVDDRSTDATNEILASAAHRYDFLKVLHVNDILPGFAPKKRALDLGIRTARGEIILLTDADCSPPPTWTKEMARAYRDKTNIVLGYSPYRFDVPLPRLVEGMLALDYFSTAAVAAASTGWQHPLPATGTNLSYRRESFLAHGGFEKIKHWISGDDDLFVHNAAAEGWGRFAYALTREAFVPAAGPTSFRQFFHQRTRYASKGKGYAPWVTFLLVAVYLLNVLIAGSTFAVLAGYVELFVPLVSVWGIKSAVELLFLFQVASVFGERKLLWFFLPTALLHSIYVSVFGLLGLIGTFKWKGDAYEKRTVESTSEVLTQPPPRSFV